MVFFITHPDPRLVLPNVQAPNVQADLQCMGNPWFNRLPLLYNYTDSIRSDRAVSSKLSNQKPCRV